MIKNTKRLSYLLYQGALIKTHLMGLRGPPGQARPVARTRIGQGAQRTRRDAKPHRRPVKWVFINAPWYYQGRSSARVRKRVIGAKARQVLPNSAMKPGAQASSSVNWASAKKSLRFRSSISGWSGS